MQILNYRPIRNSRRLIAVLDVLLIQENLHLKNACLFRRIDTDNSLYFRCPNDPHNGKVLLVEPGSKAKEEDLQLRFLQAFKQYQLNRATQ